jgi:hypothetical protein
MAKRISIKLDLKEDEVIVLYKKGSRGEAVGVYESVADITESEQLFYKSFSSGIIYHCLNGISKSFVSYNHRCRVVPRIRKREDVKPLNQSA